MAFSKRQKLNNHEIQAKFFEALNKIVDNELTFTDPIVEEFKRLSSEKTIWIYGPCFFPFVLVQKKTKNMIAELVASTAKKPTQTPGTLEERHVNR